MKKRAVGFAILLVALVGVGPIRAHADDLNHDAGGWIMLFGNGTLEKVHPDLGQVRWWFDLQPRFTEDSDFQQLLVRPGIGYAFGNASLWLGYAYILSHPASRPSIDENRIWQQFLYARSIGDFGFQSRTRLEQRFVEGGSDTGWRFREFVKLTRPLGFAQLGLAAYDEIFVDLNDTDWGADAGFAQNRLFLGLSWKPADLPGLTFELGYLNQYIDRDARPDAMNHIASLNLLFAGP